MKEYTVMVKVDNEQIASIMGRLDNALNEARQCFVELQFRGIATGILSPTDDGSAGDEPHS